MSGTTERAILAGYDWGGRSANIIAAMWPERVKAMVSVNGYLINNRERNQIPLAPKAEHGWWYQFYFATERGRACEICQATGSSARNAPMTAALSEARNTSASGADPCCNQIVPANPGLRRESVGGRWIPTARRGRNPNSGRSATRTTSPPERKASKMPHWPIHSKCSGGPARPKIVRRRSSSASSLDAE